MLGQSFERVRDLPKRNTEVSTLSAEIMERNDVMARVRSRDTKPELELRRLVHRLGYRYRLHRANLPGTPDLVFSSYRCVIFVHGCFWHLHDCPRGNRIPVTNRSYWFHKLKRNQARDVLNMDLLRRSGWRVMVVWECQIKNTNELKNRVIDFLHSDVEVDI